MTTTTADLSASGENATLKRGILGIRWVFPEVATCFSRVPDECARIGRSTQCQWSIDGRGVSREHAEIWRDQGVYWIRDLRSRNGVSINGVRRDRAPLSLGDVVRLGDLLGVFTELAETSEDCSAFEQHPSGLLTGPVLRARLSTIFSVVASELPVLLMGETGTGKEMVARAVHDLSGRAGPLRAINCAALPEALAEGELFGYRKGAYTGAVGDHLGHIREADRGTLLLDEVAELPLAVQAKLLRMLETREVQPLGQSRPVKVDVRVVAATMSDLRAAVAERRFRVDLFARFNGVSVVLPPLRERREEIVHLFHAFLKRYSPRPPSISGGAAEALCLYDWPQNVRELAFVAQRTTALYADVGLLRRHHVQAAIGAALSPPSQIVPSGRKTVDATTLVEAIRVHGGNLAQAASALQLSRGRAYRLLREAGLESSRRRC